MSNKQVWWYQNGFCVGPGLNRTAAPRDQAAYTMRWGHISGAYHKDRRIVVQHGAAHALLPRNSGDYIPWLLRLVEDVTDE